MDQYHHNANSPASPYFKETRSKTDVIVEEELSKCPMCCEFFDPTGIINDGDIILNPKIQFGTEPKFWCDELCPECKNEMT